MMGSHVPWTKSVHLAVVVTAAMASANCVMESTEPTSESSAEGVTISGPLHPAASAALCLDVVGQSTANGADVEVSSCRGTPSQQWTYDGTSLRVYGNKCLDVTAGNKANGTKLQTWDCVPGNPNQAWTRSGSTFTWTGRGKCVDLTDGLAQPGTPIQSWSCTSGNRNQQWSFGPAGGATGGSSGAPSGGSSGVGSGSGSGSASGSGADAGRGSPGPLDPALPPGGNFDLSSWDLQLPIGSGTAEAISGSRLAGNDGFSDTYFYTASDGAMTFMDPTQGVTTSGSLHPRSEMREALSGWSTAGVNAQTVTVAVAEVPSTVTIGQIFQSPPAPTKPLLELQYLKGGNVQVLLETTNQGGSPSFVPVGHVVDGSKFTYELSLTGETIVVSINGQSTPIALPSSFVGEQFYFKCGAYDQTAVSGTPGTTPGTVVKVYALSVVHE